MVVNKRYVPTAQMAPHKFKLLLQLQSIIMLILFIFLF
jgi:hypothetical protein